MKPFFIQMLTLAIAVLMGIQIYKWYEYRENTIQTLKALELAFFDLQIDTSYYHSRMQRIERAADGLALGIDHDKGEWTVQEFRRLLNGLKANVDYNVRDAGYTYLQSHVSQPIWSDDTLYTQLSGYQRLSNGLGNYQLMQQAHFELTNENYQKIFVEYPDFLDPDTLVANAAIRNQMAAFLSNEVWRGRIALTHRETSRTMRAVYEKNLNYAKMIMVRLEKQISQLQ